ncbi:hypothetical protein AMECASPLE_038684, partial [Ameca splendens]
MFCKNFLWIDCLIPPLLSAFMFLFPLPATVNLLSVSFDPPALCQSVSLLHLCHATYILLCSVAKQSQASNAMAASGATFEAKTGQISLLCESTHLHFHPGFMEMLQELEMSYEVA